MAVNISIYAEDVNERLAVVPPWNRIRLYRYSDPYLMTIALATLVTTITLVEDQEVYEYEDTAGAADSWYAWTYQKSSTSDESTLSQRWRASDTTLLTLMIEVARRCGAGYSSTTTAAGTLTTLTDAVLADSAADENFGAGWWCYWHSATTAANREPRRFSAEGYSVGGVLTVGRAWATAGPALGDAYQVYALMPPVDVGGQSWSWQRAVNEGLTQCRWVDTLNLGSGDGSRQDFTLDAHLGYINPHRDIRAVSGRRLVEAATATAPAIYSTADWTRNGHWFERIPDDGGFSLRLHPAPAEDTEVLIEVRRSGAALHALTDATSCPVELAIEAGAWRALAYLAANGHGEYAAQAAAHKLRFETIRLTTSAPGRILV